MKYLHSLKVSLCKKRKKTLALQREKLTLQWRNLAGSTFISGVPPGGMQLEYNHYCDTPTKPKPYNLNSVTGKHWTNHTGGHHVKQGVSALQIQKVIKVKENNEIVQD